MTDWDHRQLCSDGACVGLIGDDGTCKTCGRAAANWGDERKRGLLETADSESALDEDEDDEDEDGEDGEDEDGEDEDDDEDEGEDEGDDEEGVIDASAGEPPEWGQRTLCPDGSCVGVIGSDGKCKACGRAAA
jgi:hypothetical protein